MLEPTRAKEGRHDCPGGKAGGLGNEDSQSVRSHRQQPRREGSEDGGQADGEVDRYRLARCKAEHADEIGQTEFRSAKPDQASQDAGRESYACRA